MFTGLIEEIGRIRSSESSGDGAKFVIEAAMAAQGLAVGESVAIDGVCLTVETFGDSFFTAFASGETLRRSTLGGFRPGRRVNLERALALGARMGGHIVQGHVDARGRIEQIRPEGNSHQIEISAPADILRLLVEKGSIAVDGISLTISALAPNGFSTWIIPETWRSTTLPLKREGGEVNIECDLIGKYVFRYLELERGENARGGARDEARDAHLNDLLARGGWRERKD